MRVYMCVVCVCMCVCTSASTHTYNTQHTHTHHSPCSKCGPCPRLWAESPRAVGDRTGRGGPAQDSPRAEGGRSQSRAGCGARRAVRGPKLPIRDTSCCCRPLTDVPCLRPGPRRRAAKEAGALERRVAKEKAATDRREARVAEKQVWARQQTWTVARHDGRNHPGLWCGALREHQNGPDHLGLCAGGEGSPAGRAGEAARAGPVPTNTVPTNTWTAVRHDGPDHLGL